MEQEITPQQSLDIINNAIGKTKENLQQHSFGFIFWGWLVTTTSILHYLIIKFYYFESCWLIWPIFMSIGFFFSIYYYRKRDQTKSYTTYLDHHLAQLWQTTFIAFVLAFFISYKVNMPPTSIMLLLCGLGTIVTGRAMKFKPLIFGGFSFLVFAIIALYVNGSENLLINALAIFIGYLIPGHILSKK